MLTQSRFNQFRELGIAVVLALVGAVTIACERGFAQSQIVPDSSLGSERSVVTPNVLIRDLPSERIDSGAIRGANLFHSFQEFNVEEGRGVYFTNPQGIENILSRVTGVNRSEILGRLGVLGNANLFLINPNGIVFGQNASLDIEGSFFATTAEAIALGEQGYFSATQPQQSSLLSVSPGALFFNQASVQPGNIINKGNLLAGKDLTLSASNLELQGQLYAGENLTLQATDTVRIRDSLKNPFVAAARNQLLVQGNQGVDIFALNHPDSGLFSGTNMILRSANTVGGDARYWSGGSFRIEQLDGSNGNLFSPYDPIIRSLGDVSFNNYLGASLHILAAGSVNISGIVAITEPETGTDGINFITENLTLSNGTELQIDGRNRPTLDVRAGVEPSVVGTSEIKGANTNLPPVNSSLLLNFLLSTPFLETPTISNTATSADIKIGAIVMLGQNAANGQVYLSNQYKPDLSLPKGNIEVGTILTADAQSIDRISDVPFIIRFFLRNNFNGNSGDVILDSRNNINLEKTQIDSLGNDSISSYIYTSSATGKAGDITLLAKDTVSITNGSKVVSETLGLQQGGKITVSAAEKLELVGQNTQLGTSTQSRAANGGRGGDIEIDTKQFVLRDGAVLGSASGVESTGNVGNVTLKATESVEILNGSGINSNTNGIGNAGNILIDTQRFIARQGDSRVGSGVSASSLSSVANAGSGGNLTVKATESVQLIGNQPGAIDDLTSTTEIANKLLDLVANVPRPGIPLITGLIAVTTGSGSAGNLVVDTKQLSVQDGAGIATVTVDNGKAGNLTVKADDSVILSGLGGLASATTGTGDAGNLSLTTKELLTQDGAVISSETRADGNAGTLDISAERLRVLNAGFIRAGTTGSGQGKTITINADTVELSGASKKLIPSSLTTETTGAGQAGNLIINAQNLSINNTAKISAATSNQGQGGSITVTAPSKVALNDNSQLSVEATSTGRAGNIIINTDTLTAEKQSQISATSGPNATNLEQGGSITLNTKQINLLGGSIIVAETRGVVPAGTLTIQPYQSGLLDIKFAENAKISASTFSGGQGGSLIVTAPEEVTLTGNGQLAVETSGTGIAGNVNIDTQRLTIQDNVKVSASTSSSGQGGSITVTAPEYVNLRGDSKLSVETSGAGKAGDIDTTTRNLTIQDGAKVLASTTNTSSGQGGSINIKGNEVILNNGEISARTLGSGDGGNIKIDLNEVLSATNSNIETAAQQSNGGAISIKAADIRLYSSDIITNVGSGTGGGGDINMTANSILAFGDSDILTFASGGKGGNITFNTPAFFGQNYRPAPADTDLRTLQGNNRVDINASGVVSGVITLPDTSFIQNSLNELPENVIDTGNLIANSCIARTSRNSQGTFLITGSGGLPSRPGDALMSQYTFGSVGTNNRRRWQKGDPIIEPQGAYRLHKGNIVLSRECD